MTKTKFHPRSVGRVGGALPLYRDHEAIETKHILERVVLGTPLKEHSGLLDQRCTL